ncbi:apolipoprotein B mRNA editing enzyme catalytic subunit 3H [Rhinolophus ferrumequinum]|uniref:single-stranded DNA cytosine deaminase n=2 Tax=Rhinolophus ferrumequinum TaxID=59479 RepID=A0A671DMF2_RHIFE|nr:apolipoprotein B mRNA editing enzyme catalytic subunit 3H [Rhinolophus ferrumequinum]
MSLLPEEIFYYQFGNQPQVREPKGRRKTYLCYKLKLLDETLDQGYFKNKKKSHAEICFIDKICSLDLDQTQRYKIICYVTWSPCAHCAEKLVAFIDDHPYLSLQVFTSRLYVHWLWVNQRGLRRLWKSNIPVLAMTEPEFTDCWKNFVDNQERPFQPWEKLKQYSDKVKRRLQKILKINTIDLFSEQSSEEIRDLNNLVDAVRNLNLDAHLPHY